MPPTRLASQSGVIGTCESSRTSWRESSADLAAFGELLAFRAGHFGGVIENVVERAVGFEQLLGRFGADAGDAGDVVDFVADERLEIDNLVGRDAPLFAQGGGIEDLVFADVVDGDAIGDELPAVFVARDDEAVGAAFVAHAGECGEHIIGLVAFAGEDGDRHGFEHALDLGDLA